MTGIISAREAADISPEHLKKQVIYLTTEVHHCAQKNLKVAGLKHCIVKVIPIDDHYRMDTKILQETILRDKDEGLVPFLVMGNHLMTWLH